MTSGVTLGSVLGEILFLVFINDLPSDITSRVRLFGNGAALCLVVEGADDSSALLRDLDRLSVW